MKTSAAERERNRGYRSQLRRAIRELRETTDKAEATERYRNVAGLLDQAARRHLIHRRNADRNKSRLAHFVARLGD